MGKIKPLVSICCSAYNHEKYIEQCIHGFKIQKTNFPFEIIIHDDFSNDNTRELILKHTKGLENCQIIFPKENKYNKGIPVYQSLYPITRGKYIAKCDGDDYWIDPYKLQKQIDFLEKNPKIKIVYTKRKNLHNDRIVDNYSKIKNVKIFDNNDIITGKLISFCHSSICVHKDLLVNFKKFWSINKRSLSSMDYSELMFISYNTSVAVLPDITTIYRILPKSMSHGPGKQLIVKKVLFDSYLFLTRELGIVISNYHHNIKVLQLFYYAITNKDFIQARDLTNFIRGNYKTSLATLLNLFSFNRSSSLFIFFYKVYKKFTIKNNF